MAEKLKILVVDDNKKMLCLFKRILNLQRYRITTVESGKDAVERAKKTEFDLAFVDMVMPEMDGVETFKELKKINPKIVVVMMSGFAVEEKIAEVLKLGAYEYLHKPFAIAEIMTIIGKLEQTLKNLKGRKA